MRVVEWPSRIPILAENMTRSDAIARLSRFRPATKYRGGPMPAPDLFLVYVRDADAATKFYRNLFDIEPVFVESPLRRVRGGSGGGVRTVVRSERPRDPRHAPHLRDRSDRSGTRLRGGRDLLDGGVPPRPRWSRNLTTTSTVAHLRDRRPGRKPDPGRTGGRLADRRDQGARAEAGRSQSTSATEVTRCSTKLRTDPVAGSKASSCPPPTATGSTMRRVATPCAST